MIKNLVHNCCLRQFPLQSNRYGVQNAFTFKTNRHHVLCTNFLKWYFGQRINSDIDGYNSLEFENDHILHSF